ncbi:uncharacterized protein LOC106012551 [Aplysia californica]|uniref:Uncharacterized protein LOC106012551 n=1 Tax=Aplysia californica TaxID=6500 RepID=A0ABM1A5N0_APLCA|nr:uncharacterized protein LOC106012551 [Aplysia californica]
MTAVDNVDPEYQNTQAGLAFKAAQGVFSGAVPQRSPDTRKVILYLVDGTVTNKTELTIEAQTIRRRGVEVFAVGFAPAALEIDLLLASGNPQNIFRVNSDLELESGVGNLTDFLCQSPVSLTF